MANIKAHAGAVNLDTGAPIEETFVDNGDGTYARLVGAAGTVSIGQVTVADGGDAAQGATTDASTANTVIGRLKKLLSVLPAALTAGGNLKTAVQEALPSGANTIGGVRVADGADVALGTSTDAAGDPSVIGQLKAIAAPAPVATLAHTFTTQVAGATVDATADPVLAFSLQVAGVGAAASSWTVALQGSLDGTSWVTVLTHQSGTNADGAIVHTVGFPVLYLRADVSALSLGSATGLHVTILGKS